MSAFIIAFTIALVACANLSESYEMLDVYVDALGSSDKTHHPRIVIVLIECERRDFTVMQLTQYEHISNSVVTVHQCNGQDIDATYRRLFSTISKLPSNQLVAIFEDDLFLMPYSSDWFRFCADLFEHDIVPRLFSCSFWNDISFGDKSFSGLSRYFKSHSFGGLGWVIRNDDRFKQMVAMLAEDHHRIQDAGNKMRAHPWDKLVSIWFADRNYVTVFPEISRVRHLPHKRAKHLSLLSQSFIDSTQMRTHNYRIGSANANFNHFHYAGIECADNMSVLESKEEFIEHFKKDRLSDHAPPIVIGGLPRQYFEGVHIHVDADDNIHCFRIPMEAFKTYKKPHQIIVKRRHRGGNQSVSRVTKNIATSP
jgi:hypothetical protein